VGITTPDALWEIGVKAAWLKIQEIDPSACIRRLLALEQPVCGIKVMRLYHYLLLFIVSSARMNDSTVGMAHHPLADRFALKALPYGSAFLHISQEEEKAYGLHRGYPKHWVPPLPGS